MSAVKLEQAYRDLEFNHADLERNRKSIIHLQKKGEDLNREIEKALKPYQAKANKLQEKINNKSLVIQKGLMKHHELLGILKYLGGSIPEKFRVKTEQEMQEERKLNPADLRPRNMDEVEYGDFKEGMDKDLLDPKNEEE